MTSSPSVVLVALALALAPLAGAAAPFAYVPNEGSGTLSIIDTASDRVVGDIAVGQKPRGTVVSADGRTAYVSDQPNNLLVIVVLAAR
jgi:YVTN family beta-propeller protein